MYFKVNCLIWNFYKVHFKKSVLRNNKENVFFYFINIILSASTDYFMKIYF